MQACQFCLEPAFREVPCVDAGDAGRYTAYTPAWGGLVVRCHYGHSALVFLSVPAGEGFAMERASILLVEDQAETAAVVARVLTGEGYRVALAADGASAERHLTRQAFPLAVLDLGLPDTGGQELLGRWTRAFPGMGVVVMTGDGELDTAVACFKAGAVDFLVKPVGHEMVLKTVANALRHVELTRKVALLTELSRRDIDLRQMGGIVCTSAAMRSTLEMAQTIAASGFSSVLLTGESGVGKGLLARSIHKLSARQDKPFVELNCSAMPATLVESELFGHQKGAFTDAKENRAGVFELADGGVLFLDEIGDMDLSTQAKLLKVIEEQRFRRLGGTNEVSVDVAVVAATNQNLQQLVAGGRFRSDLYYRLSVFPINIPPLRQRPEDIPLLAASFLTHYARKYGKELEGFTDAASAALRSYSWPGNVRELRNVVERACLLARADAIGPEQLLLSGGTSAETAPADGEDLLPPMPLAKAEELVIRAAMKHARGNRNTAADTLQIHRTTLYKKLREYGITAAGTEDAAT